MTQLLPVNLAGVAASRSRRDCAGHGSSAGLPRISSRCSPSTCRSRCNLLGVLLRAAPRRAAPEAVPLRTAAGTAETSRNTGSGRAIGPSPSPGRSRFRAGRWRTPVQTAKSAAPSTTNASHGGDSARRQRRRTTPHRAGRAAWPRRGGRARGHGHRPACRDPGGSPGGGCGGAGPRGRRYRGGRLAGGPAGGGRGGAGAGDKRGDAVPVQVLLGEDTGLLHEAEHLITGLL